MYDENSLGEEWQCSPSRIENMHFEATYNNYLGKCQGKDRMNLKRFLQTNFLRHT